MRIHELKTIQPFFDDVVSGRKTFELRKNDRNFEENDTLRLLEYNKETDTYTGRTCFGIVVYVLKDFPGLENGYCILGIEID